MRKFCTIILFCCYQIIISQQVAVLKYDGGGDWYANPTAIPNLIAYTNSRCHTKIDPNYATVKPNEYKIYSFPIVFVTGHGNVYFSDEDASNLRNYLISGGFLHISDNYGLDPYIRKAIKTIFPENDLVEIPKNHPIYSQTFTFKNGLPKIHEHDKKPSQGFGVFYEGRLVLFYDYESDLSDGWEDKEVHNNPDNVRELALQMGANIIEYAFKH
mgnify:CR=1 FL=1